MPVTSTPMPSTSQETQAPAAQSAKSTTQPKASITISAGPQVRDLKKEALSFAPTALKRKRPVASGSAPQPSKSLKQEIELSPALPPGMSLPPGFGPPQVALQSEAYTSIALPPAFGDHGLRSDDDLDGERYEPGPSRMEGASHSPLPGFEDDEDIMEEETDQAPSLPPAQFRSDLPGFEDGLQEEDDEDTSEAMVALPPAGYQNTLVGYDSDEEAEQGPSLPPVHFQNTLPGFDDGDSEHEV